jgi:hypothetical protein
MGSYKNVEGNIQSLYYLLENIRDLDMSILAAHYSFRLHRDFPEDEYSKYLFERCMNELILFQEIEY